MRLAWICSVCQQALPRNQWVYFGHDGRVAHPACAPDPCEDYRRTLAEMDRLLGLPPRETANGCPAHRDLVR